MQTIVGIGADRLRYAESRRIKQVAVIDAELAAYRCFQTQAEADRVGPQCTKIRLERGRSDSLRRVKNIADASENISAVIERHGPQRL